MIGPDRYERMLAGRPVSPASPPLDISEIMPHSGDRLEAALDGAIVEAIRFRDVGTYTADESGVRTHVPLEYLRDWLGDGWYGYLRKGEWVWSKREIGVLFNDDVALRYRSGGWDRCACEWGSQQQRSILFTFMTRSDPPHSVNADANEPARDRTAPDRPESLQARASAAMSEAGRLLGIMLPRPPQLDDPQGMVEYLEDLRLAAKFQRFDLDVTRREAYRRP